VAVIQSMRRQAVAGGSARVSLSTRAFDIACLVVLAVFALLWLVPLAWAVDTSIKPEAQTTQVPLSWIPASLNLGSYWEVLSGTQILRWYVNSLVTSTIVAAGTVVFASMAGYALSRVRFRGRGIVWWLILAGVMVPFQVLIVPLFLEVKVMHLVNTFWGIAVPQLAQPIAVLIFKQFFDGLPRDLEDAARVDGAGWFRIYRSVWLPLSRPAVAAVAIFSFVWSWNNFLWPLIAVTATSMMTVPLGLFTVSGAFGIHYAEFMASTVLGGLPLLIVFLVFQRQIVAGLATTGLK
jgi:multiple sugar transport system permease protein